MSNPHNALHTRNTREGRRKWQRHVCAPVKTTPPTQPVMLHSQWKIEGSTGTRARLRLALPCPALPAHTKTNCAHKHTLEHTHPHNYEGEEKVAQ